MGIKATFKSVFSKLSVIDQEILREGKIKGQLEGKLEVALNLLRNQMTIEQVVMLTGLPQDSIEELAQNLTKEE